MNTGAADAEETPEQQEEDVELHERGEKKEETELLILHPGPLSCFLRLQNKTYSGCSETEEQLSHNSGGVIVKIKKPSESCFPGVIKKFS